LVDDVLFSKATDEWLTPDNIIHDLKKEFRFTLDAATNSNNPLGFDKFYTKEDNGLIQDWYTWTFCNPPYSMKHDFVAKAYYEMKDRGISSVLLLPSKTENRFFHIYIWDNRKHRTYKNVEVRFLQGKRTFKPSAINVPTIRNTAPFGSMLVIFRA